MATLSERAQILVEEAPQGLLLPQLERLCGWPAAALGRAIQSNPELFLHSSSQRVLSRQWLKKRQAEVVAWLERFHKENPSKGGAPIATARLGLSVYVAGIVFESLPAVQVNGELISLKSHRVQITESELAALDTIERSFRSGGFAPPPIDDVLKSIASDQKKARSLLEILIKQAKLVRIADGLIFHADVLTHIRTSLSAHKGRRFTVPEFKDWTQISRKFAIPLLEYLDRVSVTKRDGDHRIVL
jgi:selenocysteine-specific elongation factor